MAAKVKRLAFLFMMWFDPKFKPLLSDSGRMCHVLIRVEGQIIIYKMKFTFEGNHLGPCTIGEYGYPI